jgi:hypothetical protein
MTVQLADAHALVQKLVLVVKMATVLEDVQPKNSGFFCVFLWTEGLNAKDIHKEMFPVYGGNYFLLNRFTIGSRNSLNVVRKSQMMPDQVREWLRQQSRDVHAESFEALVKQLDK